MISSMAVAPVLIICTILSCSVFEVINGFTISTVNHPPFLHPAASLMTRRPRASFDIRSSTTDNSNDSTLQSESSEQAKAPPQPQDLEYVTLLPGYTRLKIRIGDVSLARKAWKKRRRSDSPILLPCSILSVHRSSALRWNIIRILYAHGDDSTANTAKHEKLGGGKGGSGGVYLPVSQIVRYYKSDYNGNLMDHCVNLGYESVSDLMEGLFDQKAKLRYGVEFITIDNGSDESVKQRRFQSFLVSGLSKRRAREMAGLSGTAQVNFYSNEATENSDDADAAYVMPHTGLARVKNDQQKNNHSADRYTLQPLSAAVRVSQSEEKRFIEGDTARVYVFSYDEVGDDGSPLLTTTVDPLRGQIMDMKLRKAHVKKQQFKREQKLNMYSQSMPRKYDLNDLKVGDGPISAKVVRIAGTTTGAAFVDCGVSRRMGKSKGGGQTLVLGMLRLDDLLSPIDAMDDVIESDQDVDMDDIEEDDIDASITTVDDLFDFASIDDDDDDDDDDSEEVVEDITDQYQMDEDGNIIELDPNTGQPTVLGSIHDDDEDEDQDEDDEEDDKPTLLSSSVTSPSPESLQIGDELNLYIKTISPQSGRFTVTLDPSVQGKTAKQVKQETTSNKRLSKLVETMGGEEGLATLVNMEGTEGVGVIKAMSKASGDWCYVQPVQEGLDLPVGIASFANDDDDDWEDRADLEAGDEVQIRFDGIDRTRGQLSMTVLGKV